MIPNNKYNDLSEEDRKIAIMRDFPVGCLVRYKPTTGFNGGSYIIRQYNLNPNKSLKVVGYGDSLWLALERPSCLLNPRMFERIGQNITMDDELFTI